MTAMELTDTAILSRHMAVVGYGRIDRFLAGILRGMGADVTVCARRGETLAQAACDGNRTLRLTGAKEDLFPLCHGYDVIYNTVPAPLFSLGVMEAMDDAPCWLTWHPLPAAWMPRPPGCFWSRERSGWQDPGWCGCRPFPAGMHRRRPGR